MASWVNWGKTVFLWMASQLGKVCFWCQIRCLSVARWYTCVSVFFSFLFAWMGKCYRCHHAFLNAYSQFNTHGESKHGSGGCDWAACEVEMKRSGMQEGRGGGGGGNGGETKQKKLQTVQMRAVSLHVRVFFFLIISRKPVKWRRRLKCWSKWKIATIPCYSYCNHFNPSPVCVPGCVDTVKRCDASRCMTN